MLFGWFAPKCPVAIREKAWTEVRMRWLVRQFGMDRILHAEMVLPEESFFAEQAEATPEFARRMLDRLAGSLRVETSSIELEVFPEDDMPGVSGMYEPGRIRIAEVLLHDPEALAAGLARGVAHNMLARQQLLEHCTDREWLADLLLVTLGLGILMGNAASREDHECQGHSCSSCGRKKTFLPARMIGYAMALFAWFRGEGSPSWARYLPLDTAEALSGSLRYLRTTDDTPFRPGVVHGGSASSLPSLLEQLDRGSPSARIAAIWELADGRPATPESVDAVREFLHHRLPDLRAEAARTLGAFGSAAEPGLNELVDTLRDGEAEVRAAAAHGLGRLGLHAEEVVAELSEMLANDSEEVQCAAAVALAEFGPAAERAMPGVLSALERAAMATRYTTADYLAHAIRAISSDPEARLNEFLESLDEESRNQAMGVLSQGQAILVGPAGPGTWFGRGYR